MTSRRFEASEESVPEARRFVTAGIAGVPKQVVESVALMVSELATNALVHAASGFEITVDRDDSSVLVSVTDRGDDGVPQLQEPPSTEPHGRGLRIVDALSDEWGVDAGWGDGKTVWFRISLNPPNAGPDAGGTATASSVEPGTQGFGAAVASRSVIAPVDPEDESGDHRDDRSEPSFRAKTRHRAMRIRRRTHPGSRSVRPVRGDRSRLRHRSSG